jgi:toxin ParE1/3/4
VRKRAILTPRVSRDLVQAIRWIAKDNRQAAEGLRNAVRRAAERIADHPHTGAARPGLLDEPFRVLILTGYPYLLIYNSEARPIRIVRVLHGARDLPQALGLSFAGEAPARP